MNIGDIVRIIKDFCGVGEVEVSDAIIKINAGDVNGLVSPINKEIMAKSCKNVKRLEEELTIPKDRKKTVEKKQKTEAMNIDNNNKTDNVKNKEDKEDKER